MSSPPPIDFPTSELDAEMEDGTAGPAAPSSPANPLFLPGTPSAAGTPARQRASAAPNSTPLRVFSVARRALGMATPKENTIIFGSSPAKTPRRTVEFADSDPLDFPSSPAAAPTTQGIAEETFIPRFP
ncbi:cell division control protein 54 [Coprinopsis cinerea AmutBmut pab1-1]|nr:cell division control protein 54 [Coprinopsis cinerea AmutBmut pab1-1]